MKFRQFVNQVTLHPDHLSGDWRSLSKLICEKVSDLAKVQRVGVWEFKDGGTELSAVCIYDSSTKEFASGVSLKMKEFPVYAKAVKSQRTLVMDDVYTSPHTQEFCATYFPAFGITSMLDSAIYCGDTLLGVICLEHTGPKRIWSPEVQNFSGALADLLSNSYLINQNNEAQQQLLMKSKLASIGEMSADLLHEVANPLQALEGILQLCRLEVEGGNIEEVKKHILRAEKASRRIGAVFHSMRNLMSRGDEKPVNIRLSDIIEDVELVLGQKMRDQNINLLIDNSVKEITLNCLRSGTSQVILNLVNNSIDAIESLKEKWIKIEYVSDAQSHRIVVSDSGGGIPKEVRDKMFLAMFTTKRDKKGTGIGLALCRKLMERQGGKLVLLDDKVNTTFEVSVPKAA